MAESQLVLPGERHGFRGDFLVGFHNRPEFVGSFGEGQIAVVVRRQGQGRESCCVVSVGLHLP